MPPDTLVQLEGNAFVRGPVGLAALGPDTHVICWAETVRRAACVRARLVDASWKGIGADIVIPVSVTPIALDVASLPPDGFALAWNDGRVIKLRKQAPDGTSPDHIMIGVSNRQVTAINLQRFSSGELAVSWIDFLHIVQQDSRILLSASTPHAWHSAIALLQGNRLLRLVTDQGEDGPYGSLPTYGLVGSLLSRFGEKLGEFNFNVPTTVVGDTASHPEHLSIGTLNGGGFVVAWTQLAHHLGNSIQAQLFDEDGNRIGKTLIVAAASRTAHVNRPSVAPTAHGGFLVGWSIDDGRGCDLKAQAFSDRGARTGPEFAITDGVIGGRGDTVRLVPLARGDLAALWVESQQIKIKILLSQEP